MPYECSPPHEKSCTEAQDHCTKYGVCCVSEHIEPRCECHSGYHGKSCETLPPSDSVDRLSTIAVIGAVVAVLVMAAFLLFVFWIYMVVRKRRLEERKKRESLLQVETDAPRAGKKKNEKGKCPKLQPGFSWRERTIRKTIIHLQSRMSAPVDLDKLDLITTMNPDDAGRPISQWINTNATRPTSLWLDENLTCQPTSPTSNNGKLRRTPSTTSTPRASTDSTVDGGETEFEVIHL